VHASAPRWESNLNFSPFSPDFSPRFLEKNPAHFCSGNFAGCAPGRSGNFDRSFSAGHTHVPLPGPRSKTDLLTQEHGIATGPLNRATFQSAALRAGILKLEDCTVPHMAVLILCFVFRLLASSIRESSCVSVRTIQHRQVQWLTAPQQGKGPDCGNMAVRHLPS
jgi:hypothetical protein